ncbi:MAG TPA: APC family permease [Rhizomicrobium sp.]|jgi:amino acid transporter
MSDNTSVEALGYRQELKRSLSLGDLLIYGLVFISPTAPIAVFGIVFNASAGQVPLIYLVGLMAMVFTAISYMTMSRVYPVAGSAYSYAARAIGPAVGFFAGWAILLDYLLLPTLSFVVCAIAMHAVLPGVPEWIWVVSLLALSTLVNYLGIRATARVNLVMLVLQFIILAAFVAAAVVAKPHLSLTPLYNPTVFSPGLVFGAVSLGVLSFLGFDAISTLSEETKGGPSTVARATILSLCLAAALFMVQTYLASLFVLGRTSFPAGDATDAAFYNIARTIGGSGLEFVIAVPGIVLGATAGALTAQAATARLLYSMARDGKLPRALAHVHPARKVPERAVFLVAGVTLALGLFMVSKLELLTSMVSFGALAGFLLVNASVLFQFWRDPARHWLRHVAVPVLGMAITGYVLWNAEANAKIAGAAWLVVGAVFFLVLRRLGRPADLSEIA